jgi:two-component system nitrogen regulation sensor histidine kinase NtrY
VKFRTRLLLVSGFTVAGAVALVTGAVSVAARRAFERADQARRAVLLDQFQRQIAAQGQEVVRKVERAAASDTMSRIAIQSARREPDYSSWFSEARIEAEALSLDFLDMLAPNGAIVSSAHWPARFGYQTDWVSLPADSRESGAFLTRVTSPEGAGIGLVAVREARAGEAHAYVAGGRQLDSSFLAGLGLAPGVRVLLALSPKEVVDAKGLIQQPERLANLIDQTSRTGQASAANIQWNSDRSSSEALYALPMARGGNVLGVLLVGNSLGEQVALERSILWTGIAVAGSGILLGVLLGWWVTERVTKPVEQLAAGARTIASGDWSVRVQPSNSDEIGELALAFNRMTEQLIAQRERTIQAERVAAWRELARRLAHELKNPLFPLQITVENLQRARAQYPDHFDEVFEESTATLLAELAQLKTIIGRFSDFARMPAPVLQPVNVNEIVGDVMKLFDAQLSSNGHKIETRLELDSQLAPLRADPEQLGRALRNLVLNAMDAMPEGGTLRVRTSSGEETVRIEVADSGQGLTPEECSRLFTPYYTTKQHGTGLGLAIVQSVVSDHCGRISVASEPGRGATFVIDLPLRSPE